MTAIAASLAFASPAFAEDNHHPERAQEAKSAAPAKPATKASLQDVGKMQDNVKKMQSQLDHIANAKTDDERQNAMAEHMQTMLENMQMARGMGAGMMGCPMMGGGMMGGGMGMQGGTGMPGQDDMMSKRLEMMEKRMDMMQSMMQMRMGGAMGQGTPGGMDMPGK